MRRPELRRLLGTLAAVTLCAGLLAGGITQDVPRGSIQGNILMQESGLPLSKARVTLTDTSLDEYDQAAQEYRTRSDDAGNFAFPHIRSGQYDIHVSAKNHEISNSVITVNEGERSMVRLMARPTEPNLKLYISQRVYLPGERATMEAHGFAPGDHLDLKVYRVDAGWVAKKNGFNSALEPLRRARDNENIKKGVQETVNGTKLFRTFRHKIVNRDAEGAFVEVIRLDKLPTGLYYVVCSSGKLADLSFLNITRIALVTKSSADEALCFVTDLQTGKPVAGAKLRLAQNGSLSDAGTTNERGLATVRISGKTSKAGPGPDDEDSPSQGFGQAAVIADSSDSTALCDFSNYGSGSSGRMFVYSDRPIYRPGDTVNFKGIVRNLAGSNWKLPPPGNAQVYVTDPNGSLVQSLVLPLSEHGAFAGSFATSVEAKPGEYQLTCQAAGIKQRFFVGLAAYRKPEYVIDVKPEKPFFKMGEKARMAVDAKYYFGSPVVGAKVKATVYRGQLYEYADEESGDREEYGYRSFSGGEYNVELEAVTDERGRATIEFDTEGSKQPSDFGIDYEYTVQLTIADASGKSVDKQALVKVYQGDFSIGATPQDYVVTAGKEASIGIALSAHGDEKVKLENRVVKVQYGKTKWKDGDATFTPLGAVDVWTDSKGRATAKIPTSKSGSSDIKVVARDDGQRSIYAEAYVYVTGEEFEHAADTEEGRMTLMLDKKKYSPGDTARLMITTADPGGSALVTVQAEKVLATKLVDLEGVTTLLDLPIGKAYAPNAYIDVAYVRNKKFSSSQRFLSVNLSDEKLTVTVEPAKGVYQPRDRAELKIKTLNSKGLGVPADVSLGVVDESIYAIREDDTDIVASFHPKRQNGVQTNYSFPEIYLDGGDKGKANTPIRSKFLDTAFWTPSITTDVKGEATVQVELPDNITQWRATAVAATDDSVVGMAAAEFTAKKPLMVRIDGPTFLVQGDSQSIVVAVTNDTGQDADATVGVTAHGALLDRRGQQTVRIADGKQVNLEYTLTATSPDEASQGVTIQASASIDKGALASDAVEKKLSVNPRGRLTVESSSGTVEWNKPIHFQLAADADRSSGRLAISVEPSLASSMVASLDGLINYPYGCVEQTMSRFMPAVIVERLVKDLKLPKPGKLDRVQTIAKDGLARLVSMQHKDGGWGWWEYDESNPYMTAYVLDGLMRAKNAGYQNPGIRLKPALAWAASRVGPTNKKSGEKVAKHMMRHRSAPQTETIHGETVLVQDKLLDRLYLVTELARYGMKDAANAGLSGCDFRGASPAEWAMAVNAYGALGKGFERKKSDALQKLRDSAVVEGGSAHWWGQGWFGDDQNTAVALETLVTEAPSDPLVGKAVAYLMRNRRQGMWDSTLATSEAILGMDAYLRHAERSVGAMNVELLVNGKLKQTFQVSKDTIFDQSYTVRIPVSQLAAGANQIEFRREGQGSCYYFAELREYGSQAQQRPSSMIKGLDVEKSFHILSPQRMEDGSLRLMPSQKSIDEVQSGDVVRCILKVHSNEWRKFVVIEDPIPSNCRVTERESVDDDEPWTYEWSSIVPLDDRVALFMNDLTAGYHTFQYNLRAEGSGSSHALPTLVMNMYDPKQQAWSAEEPLAVKR